MIIFTKGDIIKTNRDIGLYLKFLKPKDLYIKYVLILKYIVGDIKWKLL